MGVNVIDISDYKVERFYKEPEPTWSRRKAVHKKYWYKDIGWGAEAIREFFGITRKQFDRYAKKHGAHAPKYIKKDLHKLLKDKRQ